MRKFFCSLFCVAILSFNYSELNACSAYAECSDGSNIGCSGNSSCIASPGSVSCTNTNGSQAVASCDEEPER